MRNIIKLVFIWGLICLCGYFVFKISVARVLSDEQPQKSLRYFPEYSHALFAQNETRLTEGLDESAFQNIKNRAERALSKAPISDIPFVQIALAQSLFENAFARRDLYAFAKQRNIRSRRTLRSLLALDAAKNDLAGVMLNLDTLIRVSGQNSPAFQNIFSQIAMREEGRKLLNTYLEDNPIWGKKFIENQIAKMSAIDIPHVSKFLSHSSTLDREFENNRDLQERFLEKLVKLGAYEQAYSHWQNTLPQSYRNAAPLVFDGDFLGNTSYAPFNWKVFRKEKSFAEINAGEGLYVSYGSGPDRALAQQVLRLRPGKSYDLNIDAKWTYFQRQGLFTWYLQCLPSQDTVMSVAMDDEARTKIDLAGGLHSAFKIPPENCDAQYIQIRAKPGQYSKRIWALIRAVKISEVEF